MLNFTIGPTTLSDDIFNIAACAVPYFRTNEFSNIILENEKLILKFLSAPEGSRCVFLTTSGTGAMEAVVMNVLSYTDKAIVINGGGYGFGQRFVDLCKLHNKKYSDIKLPFGHNLSKIHLIQYANKGYTALLVNMCETSSGVLYDMPMISDFCKENKILLVVDAISSFIADDLDMSKLGIAVVIIGSQKALAVQPGISAIVLSKEAIERVKKHPEVSMYLSLNHALLIGEKGQTPFTPAVITLIQINQRLKSIDSRGGIELERSVIAEIANDFRQGIADLPMINISQSNSNAMTALLLKKGTAQNVISALRDEYNIYVCSMGGKLSEQGIRVGHIGHITKENNQELISAFHDLNRRGLL